MNFKAGFVAAMGGATVSYSWSRVFDLSWIVGFVGGSVIYWLLTLISPPPGAPYVVELMDDSHGDIIGGVPVIAEDIEVGTGSSRKSNEKR